MMQPVNTPQNDLYYSKAVDDSRAYITSNRKGSYFIEAETCCNDIYAYGTGRRIQRRDTPAVVKKDTPVVVIKDTTAIVVEMPKDTPPVAQVIKAQDKLVFVDAKLKNVKQKVGVQLYFHNDEPDARTMSDTTKLDYKQTYEAYSGLRFEYMREYGKSLKKEEKQNAKKEIDSLFTVVDKGFYDLVAFSSDLLALLEKGNKVEVTVKGFCSPLNFNEYNIKLGYRRVASLRNYFFHYRDNMLLPYVANGALTIKNESFGEETASKNISDNRLDKRNSVYSPAAALERRVEIISIELK
jgi:outer membrane protein OmpA-like peptidoglycan-associated protein